jgi:tetratricopeptide (TPR) repeat protein
MKRQTSGDKVAAALAGGTAEIANAVKGSLRTKLLVATFTAFVAALATYLFSERFFALFHTDPDDAPINQASVLQPPQASNTEGAIKRAADAVSAGVRQQESGDYASALDAFKRATAADPSNSYAWANLGGAAAKLGRATEAVQAYDHALAIDPENWLAHYNLGCQLLRIGKREEALDHISRGVTLARRQTRTPAERKTTLNRLRNDDTTRELHNDPRFDALFTEE